MENRNEREIDEINSYYEDKIGKIISNIMKKVEERMAKILIGINKRRRRENMNCDKVG